MFEVMWSIINQDMCCSYDLIFLFMVAGPGSIPLLMLSFLQRAGLDLQKMRNQCYGGAGNMSGKTKGVAARIQSQYIYIYILRIFVQGR